MTNFRLTARFLIFRFLVAGFYSHSVTQDSKCDSPVFCLLSSNSFIRAGNITPKLTLSLEHWNIITLGKY